MVWVFAVLYQQRRAHNRKHNRHDGREGGRSGPEAASHISLMGGARFTLVMDADQHAHFGHTVGESAPESNSLEGSVAFPFPSSI